MKSDEIDIQDFFLIIGQQATRIYMLEKEKEVLQQQVMSLTPVPEGVKEEKKNG